MTHPPIKLARLEPQFLRYEKVSGRQYHRHVDAIGQAQGIFFVCPQCFHDNGMKREGVHAVICWSRSRGVPDDAVPGPGRWLLEGTGYHDLTLNGDGGSRSVDCKTCWHGYITSGEATSA